MSNSLLNLGVFYGGELMLSPFYRYAKAEITPIVKPLGFRCCNRYYYRIVNDVVQQFCLLWLSRQFTIRFCVSSVYDKNFRNSEGEEIGRLIDGTNRWIGQSCVQVAPHVFVADERFYDLTPERYQEFSHMTADALQTYLLPWFDKATTPEAACRMYKQDIQHADYKPLGFLLSMHDWNAAKEYLKNFLDNFDTRKPVWYWEQFKDEYTVLYNAISQNDLAAISGYMEIKRAETYREFKWKG